MVVGGPSAQAAAEPTPLAFNPQLSLTGDCTASELDPIPDPGCPDGVHPPVPITNATAIAVDSYGNVYVSSTPPTIITTPEGVIKIFDPQGVYLSELEVDVSPRSMAVDSDGNIYVNGYQTGDLRRYAPTTYAPEAGEVEYEAAPTVVDPSPNTQIRGLAVNPENDHLFVNYGSKIVEYGSAEAGSPLLNPEVAPVANEGVGSIMSVDATRGLLYADSQTSGSNKIDVIHVFELAPPHNLIRVIDGSSLPDGEFVAEIGFFAAVDESTGHLFVYDPELAHSMFELTPEGEYLQTIEHSFSGRYRGIAIDNGANSPNGALNPEGRTIWVTSSQGSSSGHAFAFGPPTECPPEVESSAATHISEREALLTAEVQPCQLETTYRLQYTTAQQFSESGFEGAAVAGEGMIAAGAAPVKVSAGATGLSPGTRYIFRVLASNALGDIEAQGAFKTYPPVSNLGPCPNDALRSGLSALLPDCRAYELVTPANTNGLAPWGGGSFGPRFLSPTVSNSGNRVFFRIEGGVIPGGEGTGSLAGDPYQATRELNGWSTVGTGGKGSEFVAVESGGRSPDLASSAWNGVANGETTTYLRYPGGNSQPLAQGSLADDPQPQVNWISPGGDHVIFGSPLRLEPQAPSEGGVYDRRPDGTIQVVSLLPGEQTPTTKAFYAGTSPDGRGVAFTIGSKLYLRYLNQESFEIAEDATYQGVAEGGGRVFYLKEGKLSAFDVDSGTIDFATGVASVVNVAREGSAAYFISTAKLTSVANPLGKKAKAGQQNLYLSREGQISFVATVTEADVVGEGSNFQINGLGLWGEYVETIGAMPFNPSRTSADGSVLLFQSRAPLTTYDNAGHIELYRYDFSAGTLACISCNPTEAPASADAVLQSVGPVIETFPTWTSDRIENLSADGTRAFFETAEALVAADVDGLRDVYEWEAEGAGSCPQNGGCLYLISSGKSSQPDYLYGVSDDGNDVFIQTNDLLVPDDPDETRSIYDARAHGGFPPPQGPAGECLGEACQATVSAPDDPTPASSAFQGAGNVAPQRAKPRRCRKGRRAVRRHGRVRCVARKRAVKRGVGGKSRRDGRSHR